MGELKNLVEKMQKGIDVVNGYKITRADNSLRKICGCFYSHFIKLIFGLKIRDVDCDFRLIRKKVLKNIRLKKNSGAICVELIKKIQEAGFVIVETSVHHYPRTDGHSIFFNPANILKTLWDDLSLLWEK